MRLNFKRQAAVLVAVLVACLGVPVAAFAQGGYTDPLASFVTTQAGNLQVTVLDVLTAVFGIIILMIGAGMLIRWLKKGAKSA